LPNSSRWPKTKNVLAEQVARTNSETLKMKLPQSTGFVWHARLERRLVVHGVAVHVEDRVDHQRQQHRQRVDQRVGQVEEGLGLDAVRQVLAPQHLGQQLDRGRKLPLVQRWACCLKPIISGGSSAGAQNCGR
jgi:hypothetical protein